MMERPAMSADEGIWSGPVAHLGLRVERACSHQSGVVIRRERGGLEEDLEGGTEIGMGTVA